MWATVWAGDDAAMRILADGSVGHRLRNGADHDEQRRQVRTVALVEERAPPFFDELASGAKGRGFESPGRTKHSDFLNKPRLQLRSEPLRRHQGPSKFAGESAGAAH